MKISIENVRKHSGGTLKGFFDLNLEGFMKIYGCTANCKDGAWWIGTPQRKGKDKDGNDKWYSIVFIQKERMEKLRDLLMPTIKEALGESEKEESANDDYASDIPF
jgi:hypothetical protein